MALDPTTGTRSRKKRPGPRDTRTVSEVIAEGQRRHAARLATIDAAPRSVFIPPALADRGPKQAAGKRPKPADLDEIFRLALGRPARIDIAKQPKTDVSAAPEPLRPYQRTQQYLEDRDTLIGRGARATAQGAAGLGKAVAKSAVESVVRQGFENHKARGGFLSQVSEVPGAQSPAVQGVGAGARAGFENVLVGPEAGKFVMGQPTSKLGLALDLAGAALSVGGAGSSAAAAALPIGVKLAKGAKRGAVPALKHMDEAVDEWRALEAIPKKSRDQIIRHKELTDEITRVANSTHPELKNLPDLTHERAVKGVDMSVFREEGVAEMVKKLPALLARGLGSRHWYEDSAKEILAMAGGDKKLASRYAQVVAIYSAQRKPAENINLATEALRQFQQTGKITIGTGPQKQKAMNVLQGGEWEGRKTDRFFKNMLEDIDKVAYKRDFKGTGRETTNDIWVARLFGLKTDAPTPREYEEINKILANVADTLGWKPKQVQAAVWGPIRRDTEFAKKLETGSGADVLLEDVSQDFKGALLQESGRIPFETAPGFRTSAELAEAYQAAPPEVRRQLDQEIYDGVVAFLDESKALARIGAEGAGRYEGQTNSAWTVLLPAAGQGHSANIAMKPRSRQALNSVTAIIADKLKQDAGVWFRPFYKASHTQKALNGARVNLGRPLRPGEAEAIEAAMRERGVEVAVPPDHGGFSILALNQPGSKQLVTQVEEALTQVLGDSADGDVTLDWFASAGKQIKRSRDGTYVHTSTGWAGRPDIQRAADRLEAHVDSAHKRHLPQAFLAKAQEVGRRLATEETGSISFGKWDRPPDPADTEKAWGEYLSLANKDTPMSSDEWDRMDELEKELVAAGRLPALKPGESRLTAELPSGPHALPDELPAVDPNDPAFARAELAKPADDIRRMLPTARARIREQNQLRSEELARRVSKGREAFASGKEGEAAYEAAKAELRGEMPKLELVEGGIVDFNQTQVDAMMSMIRINDDLQFLEKIRAMGAVRKAVNGRLPQANEIKLLERVFGHQLTASVVKSVSGWKKWKQMGYQVVGIPRSFQASVDLSAPFRQGLVLGARHPVLFAKNLPKMVKSAGSERVWEEMMNEVGSRSTYDLMKRAKVFFSGLDDMNQHEEMFTSNLAETLTGGKYSPVRASGRGYSGFLNKFRADAFDTYVRTLEHQGIDLNDPKNEQLLLDIGNWINMASGRGKAPLEVMEKANEFLNSLFFSPRLAYSRLQLLNPAMYVATPGGRTAGPLKTKFARKQARAGMRNLAIGVGLTLGIAKAAGADIGTDPRSSDFGKIKVGDSRYDVSGGLLGFIVLAARMGYGETVSSTTGEVKPLTGGFGKQSYGSVIGGFLENKLAPVPGYSVDLMKNQNFSGDPLYGAEGGNRWAKELGMSNVPLGLAGTYEAYKVQGPGAAAATLGLGSIGFGANTYAKKAPKADVKKYKAEEAELERELAAGEITDAEAKEWRDGIEYDFVASVRKKQLKARGLSVNDQFRQSMLDDAVLDGMTLEEANESFAEETQGMRRITEKEYAKTVRELLEIQPPD